MDEYQFVFVNKNFNGYVYALEINEKIFIFDEDWKVEEEFGAKFGKYELIKKSKNSRVFIRGWGEKESQTREISPKKQTNLKVRTVY